MAARCSPCSHPGRWQRSLFGGASGLEGTKAGQTPVKEAQRCKEGDVNYWNAPSPAALLPTSLYTGTKALGAHWDHNKILLWRNEGQHGERKEQKNDIMSESKQFLYNREDY